ncbi:hypothetical protein OFC62_35905, partial [Escherichia coli]|nr:hypothetical protein [Escherichia coli]
VGDECNCPFLAQSNLLLQESVYSVQKTDVDHNIELIIRPFITPIEKFLSIQYTNVEGFPLTSQKDNYHGS